MYKDSHVTAIIPALNEESTIHEVVHALFDLKQQGERIIDDVIVCDNGSTDLTAQRANLAGAQVVHEAEKGYGAACLKALNQIDNTDIVLFLNADGAEKIAEAPRLLDQIHKGSDLVIGSRRLGFCEPGSMLPQQQLGNRLASALIRWLWHHPTTDLGPFRAIRYSYLKTLKMADRNFGWTIEMQIKAIRLGYRVDEIPVSSLKTHHQSKISGTLLGTLGAGYKILGYVFYFACVDLLPNRLSNEPVESDSKQMEKSA